MKRFTERGGELFEPFVCMVYRNGPEKCRGLNECISVIN